MNFISIRSFSSIASHFSVSNPEVPFKYQNKVDLIIIYLICDQRYPVKLFNILSHKTDKNHMYSLRNLVLNLFDKYL